MITFQQDAIQVTTEQN